MPPAAVLTSSVAYFRLHGRGRAGWTREFSGEPPGGSGNRYLYSPAELEDCLLEHDHVREVAVIGAITADGLTKPYAFVVAKEAAPDLEQADHRRHLDRLRPGAEDAEPSDHRAGTRASSRAASACMVTKWKPCSSTRAKTLRSTCSRTPS